MLQKLKEEFTLHWNGLVNSHGQIFFSKNKYTCYLLLFLTFADPFTALSGILCAIFSHLFLEWFGYRKEQIADGSMGFNALMTGWMLGAHFQFSWVFLLLVFVSSILTLTITISLNSFFYKYKLPYLSLPFVISVWLILLATRQFSGLELSERGIYMINTLWGIGGNNLVGLNEFIQSLKLPMFWDIYFKSLGAIFFQYNLLAGILAAIALLIASRISFLLSLVGYSTGFLFYFIVKGSFSELEYTYIGFNFILSAIALGGFYLIPSPKSFLLVILSSPVIAILISSLSLVFSSLQLPLYSFPFTIAVNLFLLLVSHPSSPPILKPVEYQQFSPENNLYAFFNWIDRFRNNTLLHLHLPFFGEWNVSQGYEGSITHKDEWKYALDFVVKDENNKTYRDTGNEVSQFYCYNLPILAPCDGWVLQIVDNVEDNPIGNVNIEKNWGNSIILKHSEFLYTQMNHIRMGSFKVKQGDFVKKGEIIGLCGSSGRSPEPHLHFQVQSTPFMGSHTIKYPFGYYLTKNQITNSLSFHSFDYPLENEIISKVTLTALLKEAFNFVHGKIMNFQVLEKGISVTYKWEIFIDSLNRTYIYCHKSKSQAFFVNNGTLHYFTEYKGSTDTPLYYFYLSAYKILLGYYDDLFIMDKLPLNLYYNQFLRFFHDFTAPFIRYLKVDYSSMGKSVDDITHPTSIVLSSEINTILANNSIGKTNSEIEIKNHKIQSFTYKHKNKTITAECID